MNDKIYVAIPSLYDEELLPTIADIFDKSEYPERVFLGISAADTSDEIVSSLKDLKEKYKNISYRFEKISNDNAKHLRVGYGRLMAMSMYRDEEYILQIDSHSAFGKFWDTKLIDLHQRAKEKTKNDKVVVTAYAGSYSYSKDLGRHLDPAEAGVVISGFLPKYPVFVSGAMYNQSIPSWTVAIENDVKKYSSEEILPAIKFNANFAFSDKSFAKVNTISEDVEFFEEELTQTILLIENGFSLVFPNVDYALVCHFYAEMANKNGSRIGARKIANDYEKMGILSTNYLAKENYLSFISDPKHKESIDLYQNYARMNMRVGPMRDGLYIPKYFLNSEVR